MRSLGSNRSFGGEFGAGRSKYGVARLGALALCGVLFLGCGGAETAFATDEAEQDEERSDAELDLGDGATSTGVADQIDLELQAPGYKAKAYPPAPYGVVTGATMRNLRLLGWKEPAATGYDITKAEPVSLSDFYDPDGSKGVEYLLINAVAGWCGVCQVEYRDLNSQQIYQNFKPRGLEILGVIFEDEDSEPPGYSDATRWAKGYGVTFPFVLDPAFEMGAYFERTATPVNLVVDARTMRIVFNVTGYSEDMFEQLSEMLTARGR